jgi:hypothetical protein
MFRVLKVLPVCPTYFIEQSLRVEPLPCNDREMSGYTGAVFAQRLGKHVTAARPQILNNATVGLQQ